MINEKIEKALNAQLNKEFFSSYLYLSMSSYFESKNLTGMSAWMKIQANEEHLHAMKFYAYIIQKGGRAILGAIEAPANNWKSALDAFEETYTHEKFITASIDGLVNLSLEVKDHATNNFLQWFVTEQVEEEANVTKIIDDLKMIGENSYGIFMLDRELGTRQPAPPSPAAA
ncbi:MAG: ferritin [Ignavibacteria bacterium CG22_combo_CG10-13_8_21_14_all_37_15]|nr:MAG: ferritin [Ignavibacteria bacterium CG22_combo_CG10-13_8_21_14_all_37_15]PJC57337.1 MAG: ferritin [Ignavibacteria bacterium CG_4_9_14_0_2_um_filter_37_13]